MRIAQAVFGVFHHFDLARELEERGHLQRIYSTWPWRRLKREGLPHSQVASFPLVHLAAMASARYLPNWNSLTANLNYANALLFDEWLSQRVPPSAPDALIAISGAGLKTGKLLQQQGGLFICDRGSTHLRHGDARLVEEYKRWGLQYTFDERATRREEAIYTAADAITVPSTFAARTFVESGVPAEKLHVIPYGVRLEKFTPVSAPPTDRFEVLFVGQISVRKGTVYLLQAFAQLKHPNKRLRIIGTVQPELKQVLASLPHDHVQYLGTLPQAELPAYMSSSHVMVVPSLEEGLALVQGQALACGCPVLATTNTGSEDLFTDGVEGFIVPIRDVDALRDRMQQLADDPALQQRMRAAALARVQQLGGWKQYGDRWVTLLETLTAARSPHPTRQ